MSANAQLPLVDEPTGEDAAYAAAIEKAGAITVPTADRRVAEDRAEWWAERCGRAMALTRIRGYGWVVVEAESAEVERDEDGFEIGEIEIEGEDDG